VVIPQRYPPEVYRSILNPGLAEADDRRFTDFYRAEPRRFIEQFLKIRTDNGDIVPFILNAAQLLVYQKIQELRAKGLPIRLVLLKARQLGMSSLTQGLLFTRARLWPQSTCFIAAHEKDPAENLFGMSKLFLNSLPPELRPMQKRATKNYMRFENPDADTWADDPGLLSEIRVVTARNTNIGRSYTIHAAHLSEISSWPNADVTMQGIMQAVPDLPETFVIVESTAKGAGGPFHKLWQIARSGMSDWIPIFLPWWIDSKYELELTAEQEDLLAGELDPYEKELIRKFPSIAMPSKITKGLSMRKLAWRRNRIASKCNNSVLVFNEEMATTADEAFIASGQTVFAPPIIEYYLGMIQPGRVGRLVRDTRGQIQFEEDEDGFLTVWKPPQPGIDCVIGADGAIGPRSDDEKEGVVDLGERDFSVGEVFSTNREQMAEYTTDNMYPYEFADQLAMLGEWYSGPGGPAMINLEGGNQGAGWGGLERLKSIYYPNMWRWEKIDSHRPHSKTTAVGWEPTAKAVHALHGRMIYIFSHGAGQVSDEEMRRDKDVPRLRVYSRTVVDEMTTFTVDNNGGFGARNMAYDDHIRSVGLAILAIEQMGGSIRADSVTIAPEDDGSMEIGLFDGSTSKWDSINADDGDDGVTNTPGWEKFNGVRGIYGR